MSVNLLWITSLVCGTDFPKVCVLSTIQALFQLLLSNPSPIPLLKNWNRILCGSGTQTSKLGKCRESMATKLTSLSCLHTDPSLTEVPETALQRPGLWGHGGDGPGHQPDLPTQQRGVNSPPASPSLMPLPWNPSWYCRSWLFPHWGLSISKHIIKRKRQRFYSKMYFSFPWRSIFRDLIYFPNLIYTRVDINWLSFHMSL